MVKEKIIVILSAFLIMCIVIFCTQQFGKTGFIVSLAIALGTTAAFINEILLPKVEDNKKEWERINERKSELDNEKKALSKVLDEAKEELQERIDKAEENWQAEDFYSWYIHRLERILKKLRRLERELDED